MTVTSIRAPQERTTTSETVTVEVDKVGISRLRRRARNSSELTALYGEREDIRGISPVADFFVDAVRWTA